MNNELNNQNNNQFNNNFNNQNINGSNQMNQGYNKYSHKLIIFKIK